MWISKRTFLLLQYEVVKSTHALIQISEVLGVDYASVRKNASARKRETRNRWGLGDRFRSLYFEVMRNAYALERIFEMLDTGDGSAERGKGA